MGILLIVEYFITFKTLNDALASDDQRQFCTIVKDKAQLSQVLTTYNSTKWVYSKQYYRRLSRRLN